MLVLLVVLAPGVFGQVDQSGRAPASENLNSEADERLVIARGLSEYPVTVGDQYRVFLQRGGGTSQINFSIPGSYRVNLGPVGSFSADGMTLEDLRDRVERAVAEAYPSSFPRLELVSVGLFRARLTGAIPDARIEQAWGLTRLSEMVGAADTDEASLRRVVVVSNDGRRNSYDLFLARRGASEEDPLVRPGDRIVFQPRLREISVRGEVRFPGTYEILPSDTLRDVVRTYAGGMTDLAVEDRVEIRRIANDGRAERIDFTDRAQQTTGLEDRDVIVVRSRVDTFPIVYLEGAFEEPNRGEEDSDGDQPDQPDRLESRIIRRMLLEGETLLDVLRAVEGRLHPEANLREGLIRRRATGEDVAVDMEALLYERQQELDEPLQPNDRIIIPFGIFEVFITGEVTAAGYEEVRSLDRLAQIVSPYLTDFSSQRAVTVRSANGDEQTYDLFRARRFGERDQNPYLQPGDTVIVERRDREVRITGEVERPGTYQLLPGEELGTLIDEYAGGMTDLAVEDRVEIRRIANDGRAERIDFTDRAQQTTGLEDRDVIVVRSRVDTFPIVYLEGAFEEPNRGEEDSDGDQPDQPDRLESRIIRRMLLEGETLLDVLRAVEGRLHPEANLREGLIRRRATGEDVAVDMEALLYERQQELDEPLQPNDRIIIPFGIFEVFITGEVTAAGYEEVRSLDRLAQIVSPYLTDFSSQRAVTVRSANGDEQTYDLFRARRFGERDQNPYLQPGDTVIVERRDREVRITGEVERPGTYQLLPGEELGTLIDEYAGGMTTISDPTRVRIVSVSDEGESFEASAGLSNREYDLREQPSETVELKDRDRISIPSREEFLPAVFFEGAVQGTVTEEEMVNVSNASQSDQYRHQFRPGETVADAVRSIRGRFLTTADLDQAFLERDGEQIPIDIASMLYSDRIPRTMELERNDRIVVPFRQYFVSVSGAVSNPGQYPYIPNRGYQYYLGLAGGTDPQRHIGENPRIRDVRGDRKRDREVIEPEDDIFFASTNPIYHLSPILGVASTVLSSIAIIMSLTN